MKIIVIGVAFLLVISGTAFAGNPEGKWSMSNGKFIVQVTSCGENLCGNIVGLSEPTYADGKSKIDRHNKDHSLRARPLMGVALLSDMKPSGHNSWKGKIYNPDDGETYSATVKLDGGEMKLQGCVAGILCKTQTFLRLR